ncbi:MAG: hypothetical protein KDC79_10690 [Cyclobacteriaceae bacterium]|nr:hypothetical protein [Cyclobacteriaceae bacterium]
MKIAFHIGSSDFNPRWIKYCIANNIPFKEVNCYDGDIIEQLSDCDILMWQHHQSHPKDILFAKQLLFALEQTGKIVFPDFNTAWHFDDKVGQKYLLEAVNGYLAPSWVFYEKDKALSWAKETSYPKVFKLRGGAGSQNVRLVRNKSEAYRLIKKAFGKGFNNFDRWRAFKERFRKYSEGYSPFLDVLKATVRLVIPPAYSKVMGKEFGYIYFQEFIPGNDSDTRIIVIGDKAFALKRMVRKNDFRASGSGSIRYAKSEIDERCVKMAFEINEKLNAQCLAYDFVFDGENKPVLVEISYGFSANAYDKCEGYWNKQMEWCEGAFDPYGWMIEMMIKKD